jgi:hypothetical protein
MFGVKYYMAISPQTQEQANADTSLKLIKRLGPFSVNYTTGSTTGIQKRYWNIYEVLDSTLVTPLVNQPVVMKGTSGGNSAWLNASVAWYNAPSRWSVYEAASGPASWARVSASDVTPPQKPLPPVHVSGIKVNEESMSFDVDRVGVPVVVNTSYFPNWQASGAEGPYRVTPNLMVVIPTSTHVTLKYGATPLNLFSYALTGLGVVGLVVLWRMGTVAFPVRRRRVVGAAAPAAAAGPDPTTPGLSESWSRLGEELAVSPGGDAWGPQDLDSWVGHRGGFGPPPETTGADTANRDGAGGDGADRDGAGGDAAAWPSDRDQPAGTTWLGEAGGPPGGGSDDDPVEPPPPQGH